MKTLRSYFAFMLALLLLGTNFAQAQDSAKTKKPWSKTAKGGLLGAGGGAVVGGVLGRVIGGKNSTAGGAIIGAAVGGGAGALIGRRMDKQAAELKKDMEGAKVERVGEGIKITFNSGILFAKNSATLTSAAAENINTLATTLKKYGDTNVLIEGHTDNTGTDAINDPLSKRRAQAVANAITAQGIDTSRLTTQGYGSKQPVADNSTEAGRTANRRVEVAIYANEKLKKAAEKGTI
ncbi:OmpA family protein [Hymenobacter sp. GOD-10R]|uniref:OmpA family protein n=1 Tax=Hymenobacter sp. GOD-10R TaxID=3093922 RepID=UPI002D77E615|nr:OmpA family protein [Hymenobacter sp. GOD-10R]WRQ29630.1 OmpA family protein [Hymenobacter sp. GOD-10R]